MRVTVDADIVLDLEQGNATAGHGCLEAIGYRPLAPVQSREFADEHQEPWGTLKAR